MTQDVAGGARPPARSAAFGFIFALALMNSISFGIMIPILPNLVKQFSGGDPALASTWNAAFGTVWGLMQFFCGPILGLLSDRIGRRPVLLISLFGLGVDFLFMAFAPTLGWLFAGRVLNGMTAASFSTANAYLADITPPDRRAKAFGLMGSAFGFGLLLGPALGGFLGEISLRLPFMVAAVLTLANWVYGLLVLPESLAPALRISRFDWSRANPIGSLRLLRAHAELVGLASVGFLFQLAYGVLPAIFVLYTGYRYHWTPAAMGLTMAGSGAASIAVQIGLVGRVVKRVGERGSMLLGALGGAAGFTWFALAPTGLAYLVGIPIFAVSSFLQPGLQGLMTRRVAPNEQGQLQGAFQGLQGIASVLSPVIYGLTFAFAVHRDAWLHIPGLPILIAASLMGLAFLAGLATTRATTRRPG
jgi:DHA1 family tetracycline resistance protein-like MFS transporter